MKMYSVATEELVQLLRGHSDLVTGVQLAPHNRLQVGRAAAGRAREGRRAVPPAAAGWAAARLGALCGCPRGRESFAMAARSVSVSSVCGD